MCKECEKRGKIWNGNDPKCAFDIKGGFTSDNWNCATVNIIRGYMYDNDLESWDNQQNVGIIQHNGMSLALGWYKNRGRAEELYVFSRFGVMTDLDVCEEIIKEKIL